MKRRKNDKIKNTIISKQVKYEKLRKKAHFELKVLKGYFGKRQIDQLKVKRDILKHLEANQKEVAYFGLRGVFIGLAVAIFVYLFNTEIIPNLNHSETEILGNGIISFLSNIIGAIFAVIIFLFLFLLATRDFFLSDNKRREQIYINEYIIQLVEEEINDTIDKQKKELTSRKQ